MAKAKLRIGFLGIGAMGLSHVNQFHVKNAARAECVAICSRNEANIAKALAVAPKAKVFRDERELIHSDLDAVVISTPNSTHAVLALETLKAGKHLFLEKPIGITADECRAVLAAAEASDRVVLVGHELRYSPFFQKMKALVDAGEIGRPRMVWTREFRGPFQPKSGQWIQDARLSGGMMVDKNCHHFDMMNWWVNAGCSGTGILPVQKDSASTKTGGTPVPLLLPRVRPRRVAAFGGSAVMHVVDAAHQVNDHSTVSFEYDNGVLGTLQVCLFARDFPEEELEMGIVGDAGSLQTRISAIEILQWKRGTNQKTPIVHQVHSPAGEGWGNHLGFDEIHTAFLDAVLDGKPHVTSVRDCLDGSLLAFAAEESIKRSSTIQL
ncbi:MAG: Gfo/Idh/MocA family oxidoreductase [Verrucomicrobia bacterium]|nr:Gfo/Idh/MocA family oxidoreductase [Verrucomicrobiota bacterium]